MACPIVFGLILSGCGDSSVTKAPHLEARLLADQDSVSPGSTFSLAVQFTLEPGWHIYWKNPGDSGLAPQFAWSTSPDVTIQQPLWPYPDRLTTGPLVNYGYGSIVIPFQADLRSGSQASKLAITLDVQWLVCKEECLPGEASLSIALPVSKASGAPSRYANVFESAYNAIPRPLDKVSIAVEEQEDRLILAIIPLEGRTLPSSATFFPEDPKIISNSAPQISSKDGDILKISLRRDPSRTESIDRVRGVLVAESGWSASGQPRAVLLDTNPSQTSSAVEPAGPQASSRTFTTAGADIGLTAALIFAFVGGLILNLMPCVFPVLSIKILSFVESARGDARSNRHQAIAFSVGIVASFWILAILLASLRAGGEQLGWGFQLQSPLFVVMMIFVFFTIGVLFLTDITLGQTIQNLAGRSKLPTGYIGSFLSGALATAVATPCTAPFMGSALAATISLPLISSLLVFTSLGLGMSAPYLLLSYYPSLLRFLPKPGEWMVTFKQIMAFPLFASVVWLTRVFARQMGMEPPGLTIVIDVLWGLWLATLGFWLLLRSNKTHGSLRRTLVASAIMSWAFALYVAVPSHSEVEESRSRACAPSDGVAPFRDSFGLLWESYSEDRVLRLLAQGRPVYLDFTAEWCITCQVNERVVFGSEAVRELIASKNVTLVRADWTSKNPAITRALQSYGRNGVPLNVILAGPTASPIILPNILTPSVVIDELNRLPR
jgi:thiol:disulfide interchange protein DsbD